MQHIETMLSEAVSCCSNVGWAKCSLRAAREVGGQKVNPVDPPLGFACFKAPSPAKVWMGQGEGLSDCVMATSVSPGQMVFPGVSELMAPQPGESFS